MPANRKKRRIRHPPPPVRFVPDTASGADNDPVDLTHEELEALRLKHVRKLNQTECARKMNTSQSTFQRILKCAQEKTSTALIEERPIRIHDKGCSCSYM
jgi:predicted DNA-binding protein (UPF0251 family)